MHYALRHYSVHEQKRGVFHLVFFVTMSQDDCYRSDCRKRSSIEEGMLENPTLVATTEVELASELLGYCFVVGVLAVFKQRSPGKSVQGRQCLLKR